MGLAIFAGTTAHSMTYQTINSLRRSRRKSHIPFYRSSHLSKSKSITGAGATNGYRMFSTWYPSAIDDHRNARLGYKASCIIAFALLLQNVMLQGALETTNNLYNCVYLYTWMLYVRISNRHVSPTPVYIFYWIYYTSANKLNHKNM